MAIKKENNIKNIQLIDLISYLESSKMIGEYYENISEANNGLYDESAKEEKNNAIIKRNKYRKISEIIFNEIKERIDELELV